MAEIMDDSEITKIGDFSRLNASEFKMAWDGDLSYVKASRDGISVDTGLKYASISWKTLRALQEVLGGQYPLRCVTINGEHDFRGYLGKLSCDRCGKTRRQIMGDYLADKEVEEEAEKAAGEHFAKRKSEIWPAICAMPRPQPLPEPQRPVYYNPAEYAASKAADELRQKLDREAWNTILSTADKGGPSPLNYLEETQRALADQAFLAKMERQDKMRDALTSSPTSKFWRGVFVGILMTLIFAAVAMNLFGCRLEIPYEPSQRQPTRSPDHIVPLGESVAEVPDR